MDSDKGTNLQKLVSRLFGLNDQKNRYIQSPSPRIVVKISIFTAHQDLFDAPLIPTVNIPS